MRADRLIVVIARCDGDARAIAGSEHVTIRLRSHVEAGIRRVHPTRTRDLAVALIGYFGFDAIAVILRLPGWLRRKRDSQLSVFIQPRFLVLQLIAAVPLGLT